jgi:hypothetical protein
MRSIRKVKVLEICKGKHMETWDGCFRWWRVQTLLFASLGECHTQHFKLTFHGNTAILRDQQSIFALHGVAPSIIQPTDDEKNALVRRFHSTGAQLRLKVVEVSRNVRCERLALLLHGLRGMCSHLAQHWVKEADDLE